MKNHKLLGKIGLTITLVLLALVLIFATNAPYNALFLLIPLILTWID